jgi:hypothetical protein
MNYQTERFPVTPERHTMYDSTDANDIPVSASKMAGYVNGKQPSYFNMVKRFPQSRVMGIDVLGGAWHLASVVDYEAGNPVFRNPALVRGFISNRNKLFPETACIYTDFADMPEVERIADGLWHVLWVANWGGASLTGTRSGHGNLIVATQTRNNKQANWDLSDTLTSWH